MKKDWTPECRKFLECLSAYLDGELEGELLIEFERHLKFCEDARAVVHTFRRTVLLHRRAAAEHVPREVHERLLRAIERCASSQEK